MKKIISLASLVLTAGIAVGVSGCSGSGNSGSLSATDAYGVGAVSTVKLLGNSMSAEAVSAFSQASACSLSLAQAEDGGMEAEIDKFSAYFNALDSFLGDDVVTTVTEDNTDKENYPYNTKLTISGKDINGDTEVYVMYYTETVIKEKVEGNETKTVYSLEGVLVQEGTDYYLEGRRTHETEDGETEDELKIRAYADRDDKRNYIEMKQETEDEDNEHETEYIYGIYADGKLVEETSVSFETERKHNKEQTEYELEFRQGNSKGKYEIKREISSGETKIKVKYKIDGKTGEFTIKEIIGANGEKQYEYKFSDGSKKIYKNK